MLASSYAPPASLRSSPASLSLEAETGMYRRARSNGDCSRGLIDENQCLLLRRTADSFTSVIGNEVIRPSCIFILRQRPNPPVVQFVLVDSHDVAILGQPFQNILDRSVAERDISFYLQPTIDGLRRERDSMLVKKFENQSLPLFRGHRCPVTLQRFIVSEVIIFVSIGEISILFIHIIVYRRKSLYSYHILTSSRRSPRGPVTARRVHFAERADPAVGGSGSAPAPYHRYDAMFANTRRGFEGLGTTATAASPANQQSILTETPA